jgi:hypothetical protein
LGGETQELGIKRLDQALQPVERVEIGDAVPRGPPVDRRERDASGTAERPELTIAAQIPERAEIELELVGELRLANQRRRNEAVIVNLVF